MTAKTADDSVDHPIASAVRLLLDHGYSIVEPVWFPQATELADLLDVLPTLVRTRRGPHSLRDAGLETGLPFTTVYRCEQGGNVTIESAAALLRWIGKPHPPGVLVAAFDPTGEAGT